MFKKRKGYPSAARSRLSRASVAEAFAKPSLLYEMHLDSRAPLRLRFCLARKEQIRSRELSAIIEILRNKCRTLSSLNSLAPNNSLARLQTNLFNSHWRISPVMGWSANVAIIFNRRAFGGRRDERILHYDRQIALAFEQRSTCVDLQAVADPRFGHDEFWCIGRSFELLP